MTRPFLLGLLLALVLALPAAGDDIQKKQAVDTRISTLSQALASKQQQESAMRASIAGVTARIQALETQVGDVSLHLAALQEDLGLRQLRLRRLDRLFRLQTQRFELLQEQYRLAVDRLNARLVAIFESPAPSTIDVLLGSDSIQAALDQTNYLTRIGREDRQVAAEVAASRDAIRAARARTAKLRRTIQQEARALAARAMQESEARAALIGARGTLDTARQQKLVALSDLNAQERAEAGEIDALQAVSAQLAAQIRAAQAGDTGPTATPSSAGLIWPVQGPITSPFGWRWGRMHTGIDIGVPTGTPIHAAAAGRVIYCGWEEGYGNFVVLDNGGNLATAYAHQSAIAVTCGEDVSQGQVIGYVGCTGHCTGPHLHFEVRINGDPVDPLGYLSS
jgi:murein DD-endopeptidase MepM/ murein hydrolase activator NlpD